MSRQIGISARVAAKPVEPLRGMSVRFMHAVPVPDENNGLPSVDRLTYLLSDDLQDYELGLWEVVWTLNTLAPAAPLEEKIRLARSAVSALLGQHDLWRGVWPAGPVALLTEEEKQTLAHDDTPWHDPEHATLLVWIREHGAVPRARAD